MRMWKNMTNKLFCVYIHTNKLNGKKYVGITCQDPNKRWRNGNGYKNGYFSNAIKKYGWDNFEHEIVYDGIPEDFAKQFEMELIEKYKTMDGRYGYNLCEGGNSTTGYHHTESSKSKMSASKKGMYKGNRNPMYGKRGKLAPAYGLKRSDDFKKKHQVKVIVMDMDYNVIKQCDSIIEAHELTGCDRRNISRVCRGGRPSCHGYRFSYADNERLNFVKNRSRNNKEE